MSRESYKFASFGSPGEVLRSARLEKGLSVHQAADAIHVSSEVITNIELWDIEALPPKVQLEGLASRYAAKTEVSWDEVMLEFPHAFDRAVHKVSNTKPQEMKSSKPIIFSNVLSRSIFFILLLLVIGYTSFQTTAFTSRPKLDISSPTSLEQVSDSQVISLTGEISEDDLIFVNGELLDDVVAGRFSESLVLQEGLNEIEVKSVNTIGTESIRELKIVYIP